MLNIITSTLIITSQLTNLTYNLDQASLIEGQEYNSNLVTKEIISYNNPSEDHLISLNSNNLLEGNTNEGRQCNLNLITEEIISYNNPSEDPLVSDLINKLLNGQTKFNTTNNSRLENSDELHLRVNFSNSNTIVLIPIIKGSRNGVTVFVIPSSVMNNTNSDTDSHTGETAYRSNTCIYKYNKEIK